MARKPYVPTKGPNAGKIMYSQTAQEKLGRHYDRVRKDSGAPYEKRSYSAGYIAALKDNAEMFKFKNPNYERKNKK